MPHQASSAPSTSADSSSSWGSTSTCACLKTRPFPYSAASGRELSPGMPRSVNLGFSLPGTEVGSKVSVRASSAASFHPLTRWSLGRSESAGSVYSGDASANTSRHNSAVTTSSRTMRSALTSLVRPCLSLEPHVRNTADQLVLGEEVDDQYGEHDDKVRGHYLVPLRADALHHRRESQRDSELLRVVEVDERAEEIVPRPHELEDSGHRQHGHAQRHDYPPVDRPVAGAVDPRCLVELYRDRAHVLPHQEDEERIARERRHPERVVGTVPADLVEE